MANRADDGADDDSHGQKKKGDKAGSVDGTDAGACACAGRCGAEAKEDADGRSELGSAGRWERAAQRYGWRRWRWGG